MSQTTILEESGVSDEDWETIKLDKLLARISNGANVDQFDEEVGHPITRIETIWNEKIDLDRVKYVKEKDNEFIKKYGLKEGDILLSHINSDDHLGKTAIFKNKDLTLIHGINLLLLRSNDQINPHYLNYYLKFFKASGGFYDIAQRAVNQSSVNQKKIKDIDVVLPPLPTQHRIVQKIEELFSDLDNGIENLKKARKQLETYKQSVLKAAFEGKLTAAWRKQQDDLPSPEELKQQIEEERKKYREQQLEEWGQEVEEWKEQREPGRKPRKPRKLPALEDIKKGELENLDEVPSSWLWLRTQEIGEWNGGGTPRRSNDEYWNGGTIPWVSPKDMKRKDIATTQDLMTEKALSESTSARMVDQGSILFVTRSGILRRTLPVAIAKNDLTINQDLKALSPVVDVSSEYIYWYCKANNFKIRRECSKDGTTVESIKTQAIKDYPVPICSPKEQEKLIDAIESKISIIHQVAATIEQELKKAESLRQSILKKAFEGKLVK